VKTYHAKLARVVCFDRNPVSLLQYSAIAFLTLGTLLTAHSHADQPQVDFARDVLPVLSNKCFVCHGPDHHDDTDLKLDSFTAATSDRGGYQAIDPKTPEDSELLKRVM